MLEHFAPLTLALSPEGRGNKSEIVGRMNAALSAARKFANHLRLTPSPLTGEGWGEGEVSHIGSGPLTLALSPKGRGDWMAA